jgi:uncharacterized repeat protein (TIGR01451 family)/LPXTG-motif cell wall-anchored protein
MKLGSAAARSHMKRSGLHCVAATAVVAATLAWTSVAVTPVEAAVISSFSPPVFTVNQNGAIDSIGNTLMTCQTSVAGCTAAQASPAAGNNNSFSMVAVDQDGAAFTTTNSSRAALSMPAGSSVLWAGLYWGAQSNAATRNTISFRQPGAATYTTLTGAIVGNNGADYQAFRDVTSLVSAAGNGDYWGGNVQLTAGSNQYAGWSLVVAYRNPTLPMRNLTVFDGYGIIQNATGDQIVDIEISGFLTPPAGPVNAEIGVVAYEGDGATTGDALQLSNNIYGGTTAPTFTTLTNAVNGSNNFFNSTISDNGVSSTTDISPSFANTLGFDIDEVQTTGILPNSSTKATLRASTAGDTYYPGVFTVSVDLYAPSFPNITKTVTDINGGLTEPGDTLEYRVTLTNTGLDPADLVILRDIVPANTTFVAGSVTVGGVAQTDAVNTGASDFGDYLAGTRTIEARAGVGATGTSGGTLGPNANTEVRFRVTVDTAASGTTIPNEAVVSYRARTIAQDFTYTTNKTLTPVTGRADLVITKTAAPNPAVAGQPVTWTVNITNNGPNPAEGVVVSDALPAGAVLTSVTPGAPTCTGTTTVSCSLGTVSVGTTTITIVGAVDQAASPGSVIVNSATVKSTTADPVPGNESATSTTPIVASADLAIAKTVNVTPIVPGGAATYTVTVTNPGPSQARNVIVSDVIPAGFTPTSITSPAATCVLATAICTTATLNAGQSIVVTIVGTTSAAATTAFVNTAKVSSDTTDPTAANNTVTLTTSIAPSADVSVVKTTLTTPVVAGKVVRYQLRVVNAGPSTAAAVKVSDPLPAGTTFINASTPIGTCAVAAGTLSCDFGSLPPTSTVDVLVDVQVAPGTTGTLANTATVSTTTPDPVVANNSSTVSNPIVIQSDLRIAKVIDSNPVLVGNTATWTITVTNDGPSATSAPFSIADTIPLQFATATVLSTTGPMSCSVAAGNALSCASTGSLAVGSSAIVRLSALAATAGATQNTATVTSTQDPNAANNSAVAESQLNAEADLTIDKAWTTVTGIAGATAKFTITVLNNGPSTANAVAITDALPAGLTVASIVAPTTACAATTAGATTVSCTGITLVSTASYAITVTVNIAPGQSAGPLLNTASTSSTTADRNPNNNTDVAELQVLRSTTISLTKAAGAASQIAGNNVTYTLVFNNTGPSTAEAAVIGDKLPAGSTFVSSPDCTNAGGVLNCALGSVGVGVSRTVAYTVKLDPSINPATVLTNTASAATITPSNGPVNATANVTVNTVADLGVTKTATPNPATPGGPLSWTITYTNNGLSDARNVTMNDPVPTGFVVASAATTAGACTFTATNVGCTVATLAPGKSVVVTVTGTVATSATGSLANTATVASATPEPAPNVFPNTASATVPLQPQADLVIAKTASVASVDAGGGNLSYTMTAVNIGPSNATSVVLTDTLPAGFVVSSITPAGLCGVPAAGAFTCNLGTLAVGSPAVQIVVSGNFPASVSAGPTTNSVVATSATPLTNTANDTASAPVAVTTRANLVAAKKASPDPTTAGTDITWVLQVGNSGPSVARGATLTDAIPAGIDLATVVVTAPVGITCNTSALPNLSCTLGDVAVGELKTISVTARVTFGVDPGVDALVNTVNAASPTDADGATATVAVDVVAVSDVSITKAGPAEFVAGDPTGGSWTIIVTNSGPSAARSVVITDPTVAGMSFGTPIYSPTGLCAGALPCTIPAMAPGTSLTITLPATINQAFAGTSVTNAVSVAAVGDVNATNNGASVTVPVRKSADLELRSKVDSPDPVVAGQTLTYTLNFRNAGPSQAANVVLVDPLPAGVTLIATSLPAGCVESPVGTVRCTIATLNATTNLTSRAFQVTVASGAAVGSTLINTATISSDTPDPGTFPNTAAATTTVSAVADISVTKTASPSPAVPGQPLTYTITVTNNGPSTARAVTMNDTTLTALTGVTATTSAGTCTTAVSCALGDIPAAAGSNTVTVTVKGTVRPDQTAAISNTASVATTTAQGANTSPDTVTISTPVAPVTDVSIDKVLITNPVVPGLPVQYELRITNAGPSTAQTVVVTDTLAAALSGAAVAAPFNTSCSFAGNALTCNLGALNPGTSTIVVNANLAAGFTGSLANTATVSTTTNEGANTGPNTDTVSQAAAPSANLAITKVATPDPVSAGSPLTYTITVSNAGPSTAVNAVVSDALPGGFNVSSISGGGCAAFPCILPTVAVGAPVVITVAGSVAPAVISLAANSASVTSPTADPNTANNTATASPAIVTVADVGVTKSALPATATAGQTITWTVTADNAGPSVAANVRVTDTLPIADLVAASIVIMPSTGTCTAPSIATGVFTCAFGLVAPTETPTVTVTAIVKSTSLALQLVNSVAITTDTNQGPNNVADSASTTTPLVRLADAVVVKTAVGATGVAGQNISYTITVSNPAGPSAAQAVDLRDEAPQGTQFVSATVTTGTATCTTTTAVVTCAPRQLDVGQAYTVTVVLATDPVLTDGNVIPNIASITTTTPETSTANNISTANVTLTRIADIGVSKTVSPATVNAGEPATWTITVTNFGPSIAEGVTLTDAVPAEFAITAVTDNVSPDACAVNAAVLECVPFDLALNASLVVTVTGTVQPGVLAGSLINTATVNSPTPQGANTHPNQAVATLPVTTSADLRASKTVTPDPATAGDLVTYAMTVTNDGPSDAQNVLITDVLPSELVPSSIVVSGAGCTDLPCNIPTLLAGDTATVTVTATVDAAQTDVSNNTVIVSSATPDPVLANNQATADPGLLRLVDLSISKSATGPAIAGTPLTYTLVISNAGPSVATNVVVDDVLPTGQTLLTPLPTGCTQPVTGTLHCTFLTLAVGVPQAITFDVNIDPAQPAGPVINTATIGNLDGIPDNGEADNSSSFTTDVTRETELTLTKASVASTGLVGGTVSYDVTVTNAGPSTAEAVTIADPAPAGTTVVSAAPGAGLTCTTTPTRVDCAGGTLAVGVSRTVRVTLLTDYTLADGTTITNTATADTSTPLAIGSATSATATITLAESADVLVQKSVSPANAKAGEPVVWTVKVTNTGVSDANNVLVADTYPTAFIDATVIAQTIPATCTTSAAALTCAPLTLVPGGSFTIAIGGRIDPAFTGGTVANTAAMTTTSNQGASVQPDNATATLGATQLATLTLAKTGPTTAVPGVANGISWTITVSNSGPSDSQSTIVDDTVPAGVTVTSVTPSQGTCTALPCNLGTLSARGSATVTVVGTIAATATGSLTNAATVSSATTLDPGSVTADSVTTTLTPQAALTLTKTGPATISAGGTITWTVAVTNAGPSVATAVSIDDTLPAGLIATSVNIAGACTALPCAVGSLAVGATATLTITAQIDPAQTADISNTATVVSPVPAPPGGDTRSATLPTTVNEVADLLVTKTGTNATAGQGTTWTITITNNGPSDAIDVAATDLLNGALTAPTINPAVPGCTLTGQLLNCLFARLPAGATVTVVIDATVAPAYTGATIGNTVNVSSPTDATPNTATGTITVATLATLTLDKTGPVEAVPGVVGGVTWVLKVTNTGPSDAQAVTLGDTLPAVVSVVSVTPSQGACAALPCNIGTLTAGTSATVTVIGTIAASATGSVINAATLSTSTPIAASSVLTDSVTTTLVPGAALTVAKTGPARVNAGENVTWTITVSNAGPSVATDVLISDALPAGLVPGAEVVAGACIALPCTIASLAVGGSATITVTAPVDSAATADLTNVATVTSPVPPPAGGDTRTASVTTIVDELARIRVAKTLVQPTVVPGLPVRWQIEVVNDGPSDAVNVSIADTLPLAALSNVVISSTSGCTAFPCVVARMTPRATETIFVDAVAVTSLTSATLTNTASATSATPDDNLADNTSTATSPVAPLARLSITKTGPTAPVAPGTAITWTLTVHNGGPSDAQNVVVRDQLPNGLDISTVVVNGSPATCTLVVRDVACSLASLTPGPTNLVVTITATTLNTIGRGGIDNRASVDSTTPDDFDTDNSASVFTATEPIAAITVTGSAAPATVAAGTSAGWTFRVANGGPSAAADVVVTVPIPASLTLAAPPTLTGAPAGTTVQIVGGQIVVTLPPQFSPGAAFDISFTALVVSTLPAGRIDITATAVTSTPEPIDGIANNAATAGVDVVVNASLTFTKTAAASVDFGANVDFTLTISNAGTSTAQGAQVVDVMPAGLVPVAATAPCAIAGQTVTCDNLGVAPGSSLALIVTARAVGLGAATNTAQLTCGCSAAPLSASAALEIVRHADLSLTKTASVTSARVGDVVTYTVTVTNNGPDPSGPISITEQPAAGLQLDAASPSQGSFDPATNVWSLPDLAPNSAATMIVRGTVTNAGLISNTVTLASSSGVIDPTPVGSAAAAVAVGAGSLPRTGTNSWLWIAIGAVLMVLGAVAVVAGRRRRV